MSHVRDTDKEVKRAIKLRDGINREINRKRK